MPHVSFNSHPQLTCAVVSPKFCSRGARARGARVPKFVVTKSSRSESSLKLGLQKRIWLKFFATACHSNSNQCFNMRDRPVSTNKNRPYLLQMSNYTVYFNAKWLFWTCGQVRRNGQQLVLCQSAAQCPVQRCRRAFANYRGHVPQCPMPGDATGRVNALVDA